MTESVCLLLDWPRLTFWPYVPSAHGLYFASCAIAHASGQRSDSLRETLWEKVRLSRDICNSWLRGFSVDTKVEWRLYFCSKFLKIGTFSELERKTERERAVPWFTGAFKRWGNEQIHWFIDKPVCHRRQPRCDLRCLRFWCRPGLFWMARELWSAINVHAGR